MIYIEDTGETDMLVVYDVHMCGSDISLLSLYVPFTSNSIPRLKELIARQTSLDPKHMEIYLENILFGTEPVKARDLPLTTVIINN